MPPDLMVKLANDLLNRENQDEAAWRAAAHLCYYAVYHLIAQYFRLDPANYGAARHEIIRDLLRKATPDTGVPRYVTLARRNFPSLWRLRVSADYLLGAAFSGDDADQALGWAQQVFRAAPDSVPGGELTLPPG
jgi:hypothetical protein